MFDLKKTSVVAGFVAPLLALQSAAWAGPEWKEDDDGGEDAGSFLQNAQNTTGDGPMTSIFGTLEGLNVAGAGDFEDAYLIFIEDPPAFSASCAVNGGTTEFNSRMYLFDMNALGLLGNDDTGGSAVGSGEGNPFGSTFQNFSTDNTGIVVTEPGIYLLAVTFSPNQPRSGDDGIFVIEDANEVSGPDGPGGGNALGNWAPEPVGACLFKEFCLELTEAQCSAQGGSFVGGPCSFATAESAGPGGGNYRIVLTGTTFANMDLERSHPGWNWVDTARTWTANQPAYWSALTGGPGPDGAPLPPFTVLDPSADPLQQGRPATDGTDDRVLRGFVYAWAVDADDREISHNHLKGDVTIVNYQNGTAWEYNAWAFQDAANLAPGTPLTQDFRLDLDGDEYVQPYSLLLLDFYAPGSSAFGDAGGIVTALDTDLTLHPVDADLRQEGRGPYGTKASFVIWNEDETQFTNLHRCITCWDQQLLSLYTEDGLQNHFLSLQTDKGKARIDGIASILCSSNCCLDRGAAAGCEDLECQTSVCTTDLFCCAVAWDLQCAEAAVDLCSVCDSLQTAAPMLGVAAKHLSLGVAALDNAGTNLIGMGTEDAAVLYDGVTGGGEPPTLRDPGADGLGNGRSAGGPVTGGPTSVAYGFGDGADRVSGTEKGSFLVFSKVEIRWSPSGSVIQDTFLDLTNDLGDPVRVKLYFVNGDAPTP